ncbi:MAG: hypothetical protein BAJALOKI1v1_1630006 [Promethearchaeota archaeon]|nr:MAG: hypothetical protein BAJALOKI1v1_1630006 [Candidatus Lokiarchaeota archaeon]
MTESEYQEFMVYELLNNGDRERLDLEESELQTILNPEQVFVIVKEELRRIYIWKGAKSPVRKRFISSRVASKLQDELVKEAAFHRCKIVSVDQGDEPEEFLKSFNLKSMEVKERLADMRYVRNIDKDPSTIKGRVVDSSEGAQEAAEQEYYSPALEELKHSGGSISTASSYRSPIRINTKEVIDKITNTELPEGYQRQNFIINQNLLGEISKVTNIFGEDIEEKIWEVVKPPQGVHDLHNYLIRIYFLKNQGLIQGIEILKPKNSAKKSKIQKTSLKLPNNSKPIQERILEVEPPENYKREHLIVGQKLYGTVSKKAEVFGEEQEIDEWNLIKKVPKEIISLEDYLFRVYFSEKENVIEAIEVLRKANGKTASSPLKEENPPKEKKRKELPKIPSNQG